MKKILTIIGARPQFIKASVVSRQIGKVSGVKEVIIHTGQHFDVNMSDIFFEQLNIPRPDYQLNINGGGHGSMTGRMIVEIEQVLLNEKPDLVLVYGDTNSTLAGALTAAKLHIPIAHVESGLRSFNMAMPEEVNRILTDRLSDILFCPTIAATENLQSEGYPFTTERSRKQQIERVGDVMQDSVELFSSSARAPSSLNLDRNFILATIHRAENTDDINRLKNIIGALNKIACATPVVLPIHPRTQKIIFENNLDTKNLTIMSPVGYLEMLWLIKNCDLVVTDSGGLQKEAFFMGKACVTIREQTEWVELVEIGVNELVGVDGDKIELSIKKNIGRTVIDKEQLYGGGLASLKIVRVLTEFLN